MAQKLIPHGENHNNPDLGEAVLIIDGPSGAFAAPAGSRSTDSSAAVVATVAGMTRLSRRMLVMGGRLQRGIRGPQMRLIQEALGGRRRSVHC